MITTINQARKIQEKRVEKGQYGWAKAVRRAIKKSLTDAKGKVDWDEYHRALYSIPHIPPLQRHVDAINKSFEKREDITSRKKAIDFVKEYCIGRTCSLTNFGINGSRGKYFVSLL